MARKRHTAEQISAKLREAKLEPLWRIGAAAVIMDRS